MHSEFRLPVIAFSIFACLQFLSGLVLFSGRAGVTALENYEYYMGSEAAVRIEPGLPDRFLSPKTLQGVIKTQGPHSAAFGILFFILWHLVRSLGHGTLVRILGVLFFSVMIVDFLMPFLLLSGWPFLFYLRFPVACLFAGSGIAASLLLCVLAARSC